MSFLKSKPAKSTQSSISENVNNPLITSTYGGQMNSGVDANNFLMALLTGRGDTAGAQAGLNNYLQFAGYEPAMRQLSRNVTGQAAAAGALGSGSYAKALQSRGAELNQGFTNNYLQQLLNLSGQGLQAGSLVANAGQRSTSQGMSIGAQPSMFDNIMGGIGKVGQTIGGLASIFSDRRLKRDIEKVGEFPEDGLPVYRFRYEDDTERHLGVMADEVEEIRPWAMGPEKAGFKTVNYGAL